jgi:hypothetical protein
LNREDAKGAKREKRKENMDMLFIPLHTISSPLSFASFAPSRFKFPKGL